MVATAMRCCCPPAPAAERGLARGTINPKEEEEEAAQDEKRQVLVRLDNERTYLLSIPHTDHRDDDDDDDDNDADEASNSSSIIIIRRRNVLRTLSKACLIPLRHLRLVTPPNSPLWSDTVPLLAASTAVPIVGGKGGFGTLLKGQSKQAGAKTTLDFGACRDLSGRRLRHVNDEVKLRKWRDAQARRERGLPVNELEELKTASGIRNWHLMVPGWADGAASSNKARRKAEMKMRREVERWQSREERERRKKQQERDEHDRAVAEYVRAGEVRDDGESDGAGGQSRKDVVLEVMIMKKRRRGQEKKQQRQAKGSRNGINDDADDADADDGRRATKRMFAGAKSGRDGDDREDSAAALPEGAPSFLCTLSGEVVTEESDGSNDPNSEAKGAGKVMLQSQSEFATAAVLLTRPPPTSTTSLYYEVAVKTAGLAQVGWAKAGDSSEADPFRPNSDTGDGVGDDAASYGYDGLRGLRFHGGREFPYGAGDGGNDANEHERDEQSGWRGGDVVGCTYDLSKGVVSYSLNGRDLGTAFSVASHEGGDDEMVPAPLCPALSLNQGEIVQVNVGPNFCCGKLPVGCVGVCELIDAPGGEGVEGVEEDGKPAAVNSEPAVGSDPEPTSAAGSEGQSVAKGRALGSVLGPGMILPAAPPRLEPAKDGSKKEDYPTPTAVRDNTTREEADAKPKAESFNLTAYESSSQLEGLGMDRLKDILYSMGAKCGGSLKERAERLFSLKGMKREDWPKKVRGKNFVL